MTIDPKNMADKLRQGLVPLLKSTIGDLEAHYANLRARELRKAIPQPKQASAAPSSPAPAPSPHETALEELKNTHGIPSESVAKIHGYGDDGYEYAIHGQTKDGRHFLVHQNVEDGMWSDISAPEFFSSPKEMRASQSWSNAKNTLLNHSRLGKPELRKAEACQKCGDMHQPLEKCGDMAAGKADVKKEEAKMNPAPLKDRKVVADQKAAPDAANSDSVLPTDKKSKDLTDKKTGSGGQLEKIRKAAMSENKKVEKLAKPGTHTEKEKRQAEHIKESYESKGRSPKAAESLAWATMNKNVRDSFDWGAVVSEPLIKAKSDVRSVPMEALHGQRVHAYRNLHNGLFSLWKDGKVVAHVPEVHLDDAKLHVREGGRQRVVKEKRKNVHAFVIGTVNAQPHADAGEPVIYNPYMHGLEEKGSFVRASDQSKIGGAAHVHMKIVDDAKGLGGKRALMSAVGVRPLEEKPMAKAAMTVSMAKPPSGKSPSAAPKTAPTKAPTAAPASSSSMSPKAPKAPKAPGAPAMKSEQDLAKAGPRLGGRDPMSQGMTSAASKAAAAPQIPGRKVSALTPEDHARRAAGMAAFTPASAFGESDNQGAAGGALKPLSPSSAPSGLDLARQPNTAKKPSTGGGLTAPKSLIPGRKSG